MGRGLIFLSLEFAEPFSLLVDGEPGMLELNLLHNRVISDKPVWFRFNQLGKL